MPQRFVILHHRQDPGEHWDLMLESGACLRTWQLLADPTDPANYPIPACRIGDHRLAYLTYEGPLTGNRGHVGRIDEGTFELHGDSPEVCDFSADGVHLRGRFLLRHGEAEHWILAPTVKDAR